MGLGRRQKQLLVEIYKREEEEYARWRDTDALPLAGTAEERAVGLDRAAPAVKSPFPRLEARWHTIVRRVKLDDDPRVEKNLARVADSLEDRGLIWIKPPRTGSYRLIETCGLTRRGRVEASRQFIRQPKVRAPAVASTATRHSEIVGPHYRRWQTKRTELEARLRDEDFVMQASDEDIASLQRSLTQARTLQEYADRVLPEIEADHLMPDPPGAVRSVLTITASTRLPYNPVDEETMQIINAMVRDVASRASTKKQETRATQILKLPLDEDEE